MVDKWLLAFVRVKSTLHPYIDLSIGPNRDMFVLVRCRMVDFIKPGLVNILACHFRTKFLFLWETKSWSINLKLNIFCIGLILLLHCSFFCSFFRNNETNCKIHLQWLSIQGFIDRAQYRNVCIGAVLEILTLLGTQTHINLMKETTNIWHILEECARCCFFHYIDMCRLCGEMQHKICTHLQCMCT